MSTAVQKPTTENSVSQVRRPDVEFTGGAGDLLGTQIIAYFITIFTFGICFPWALCMLEKWKVDHTLIDGKRMEFKGSAIGLFGNWIKWWFLTAITFGIYSFWVIPELNRWKAQNTFIIR
jgi:uncharacterized membrane protein YjgN (DUF898 family)